MAEGFTLGDHTFLAPSEQASMDRWDAPKRQIVGAPPPACLDGLVREARPDSKAAAQLREGSCCGHGEPTLTIFDVVIDGQDEVEVSVIIDKKDTRQERNHLALVVRKPGTTAWTPIFRRAWEDRQETLSGVLFQPLTEQEQAAVSGDAMRARVSIGFEYPCDAGSRDEVSWVEIHALPQGADEPVCLISAELA